MARTPMLTTSGLYVRFGGVTAVRDANFTLEAGRIHGLIGPNGAGKSTFFNAISGVVPTSEGRITFKGQDITKSPAHKRAGLGIQRTFQSVQLVKSMSVLENILVGLHGQTAIRLTFSAGTVKNRRRAVDRAREIAELFGLKDVIDQEVGGLPFQQQRFTEVARAVVSHPDLLLLDEPAGGLSPHEIEMFEQLLLSLQKEMNLTILLVEHVISLVMKVCERVSVLETGSLIATGTGPEIAANQRVINAYLGGAADA